MIEPIVLDSYPLSLLCHPNRNKPGVEAMRRQARRWWDAGRTICIAEIADYEVRRELLRVGKPVSLRRLDQLYTQLRFLPLDSAVMRRSAELWAKARREGIPTAPPEALDGDVILAAQADAVGAIIATDNIAHLSRYGRAVRWQEFL